MSGGGGGPLQPPEGEHRSAISMRFNHLLAEHRSFWGVGAAQSSSEAVLLHVFVTGEASGGGGGDEGAPSPLRTTLRGYFFLESVSHYRLSPWYV